MSQSPIDLKGCNFTLSVVYLNNPQPDIIRQALEQKVQQSHGFLHNAPIVLNIAKLPEDIDLKAIKNIAISVGLCVAGISGCKTEQQKNIAISLGLPILTEGKSKKLIIPAPIKTIIIDTPVRTGQQIYARDSDLIVTTHVNSGAELIADGNIHVYGTMRGRALAGAKGNTESRIFCTHLMAELVSIAGQYWLSDQIPPENLGKTVQLYIKNNMLAASYLK